MNTVGIFVLGINGGYNVRYIGLRLSCWMKRMNRRCILGWGLNSIHNHQRSVVLRCVNNVTCFQQQHKHLTNSSKKSSPKNHTKKDIFNVPNTLTLARIAATPG